MLIITPGNVLCYSFFLPTVNTLPVLIADSIKYVMIFRTVLPREVVVGSVPQLVRHLTAYSQVVHTYAACAIEKILVMKAPDGSAM
jgi:exportin-2 (importin alpha re-exporter)